MNDLKIIIKDAKQMRSQTPKTKIKRFLLRKRPIRNVIVEFSFPVNAQQKRRLLNQFADIKRQVIAEMKAGKNIPVKY